MTTVNRVNWYCIEVKQGDNLARKLVIANSIRDQTGQILQEPAIGADVGINTVQGTLIASSVFGITPLDVFDEIMTSHSDLNAFLTDNSNPTQSSYSGCAIRCFILLCNLVGLSMDKEWGEDPYEIYSRRNNIIRKNQAGVKTERMAEDNWALNLLTNHADKSQEQSDGQNENVLTVDDPSFSPEEYELTETQVRENNSTERESGSKRNTKSSSSITSSKKRRLRIPKRKKDSDHDYSQPEDDWGDCAIREMFECEICGDSYDSEEKLKKHLASNKVWNGGAHFKCAKCSKGFHTETALNKHVAHGHPELLFDRSPAITFDTSTGEVKWKCIHDSCGMLFDQNLSAQIHDAMQHRDFANYERNFRCKDCFDWFETTQEISLHTQLAHKDRDKDEHKRPDKFSNTGLAVKGEKDRERRCEICKYPGCGKKCRNYWELAIHTRSCHPSSIKTPEKNTYQSIKYGKNVYHYHKDLYLLKKDHELHKTTLKKRNQDNIIDSITTTEGYLCPVPRCDRIFMNSAVYFTHVEIHNLVGWPKDDKQRCFPCDQCNKSYDNSKSLDGHRHTKHNPYWKGYNCPEPMCEVVSASRAALSAHILTHTALRPYQCKLCGKAYKQKNTLHDHIVSVHEKKRSFKCTIEGCDRAFHFKYDLLSHVRRHTGEKPYQCEQCGFRTSTANGLRTHKISHSDARPYTCEHCGGTYKQAKHLNRHQKTCTGHRVEGKLGRKKIRSLQKMTFLTEELDLSGQLNENDVSDSQLLQSESLSMVIDTNQLPKDDNGVHSRIVLTTSPEAIGDYPYLTQQQVSYTKHEEIDETGQNTQTIEITTTDDPLSIQSLIRN